MTSELFEKNLGLLQKKDPLLAKKVRSVCPPEKYLVSSSKSGLPFLSLRLPNGSQKTLLSSYNPAQEASRFLDSCKTRECLNFLVLGIGLGYHAVELLQRIPRSCQVIMVEKELELFHLALMHCDLSQVIEHPGVRFHIGENHPALLESLQERYTSFVLNGLAWIDFKPLVELDLKYYEDLIFKVDASLAEAKVDLKTKTAFSKTFYENIINNWKSYLDSPGIHSLKNYYSGFPAVIVSAGPSLEKNIQYLKHAAGQAVIIAVGTALKPLLKIGIEPDFVVALDPSAATLGAFQLDSLPQNTWLIFDPAVPRPIPEFFPEKKIVIDSGVYLSEWMAKHHEEKGNLGKIFSVAHAAFLVARFLGCEPIALVGQDLAFSRKRLHCKDTFYDQDRRDKIGFINTLKVQESERFLEFSESFRFVKDLFGYPVTTTEALELYKTRFEDQFSKSELVYNATEGGVPIPGGENVCLREALWHWEQNPIHLKREKLSSQLSLPKSPDKICNVLNDQALKLRRMGRELEKIRLLVPHSPNGDCLKKEPFVRAMESCYQSLIRQPDTLKLMQGYMYSGFVEWNQENGKISLKELESTEEEILEEKFERDETFLAVLEEAANYLAAAFEEMAQAKNRL